MNFETFTQPKRDTEQGLELQRRVVPISFTPCCCHSLYNSHLALDGEAGN